MALLFPRPMRERDRFSAFSRKSDSVLRRGGSDELPYPLSALRAPSPARGEGRSVHVALLQPDPPAVIPAKAGTQPEMKRFNSLQLNSARWNKIEKVGQLIQLLPAPKTSSILLSIPATHAVPTKHRAGSRAARGRLGGCVDADHRPRGGAPGWVSLKEALPKAIRTANPKRGPLDACAKNPIRAERLSPLSTHYPSRRKPLSTVSPEAHGWPALPHVPIRSSR